MMIEEMCSFVQKCNMDLIGPIAIILAAYIAWRQHRRIAARRGTLDFILKNEVGNREWREMRLNVREIMGDDDRLEAILNPRTEVARSERLMVGTFLSHCEFIAVAVKHETMDEKIYKEWNGPGYVRIFDRARKYIVKRRKVPDGRTRYCNFEELADKWRN